MLPFIKRNALLLILFSIVFVTVVYSISPLPSDSVECDASYTNGDYTICDVWPEDLDEIVEKYRNSTGTPTQNSKRPTDASKYTFAMPVSVGTRWVYEGKRLFYDNEVKKNREVVARKVIEIVEIEEMGDSLRVSTKETYTNDPEFTERKKSYLVSESGFDFGTKKVATFPLIQNQHITEIGPENSDIIYFTKVTKVHKQEFLGKEYQCYDISESTAGDTSFETFCEGLGYIRDYYEHHGTPNEWDYLLVRVVHPDTPVCPDDYTDSEEQMQDMNNWTNQFFDKNPEGTMLDWVDARLGFFQENNCVEALQRLKDAENGNADPETMEVIDGVLDEFIQ